MNIIGIIGSKSWDSSIAIRIILAMFPAILFISHTSETTSPSVIGLFHMAL